MNKASTTSTIAPKAVSEPAVTELRAALPGKRKTLAKRVEYTLNLSEQEHAQLLAMRSRCREAGMRASKSSLMRAALAILHQQSSLNIEAHLQQLANLKPPAKRKNRLQKA